jgi:hypothetical protein
MMHCPICNNRLEGSGCCTSSNSHFFFEKKYFPAFGYGDDTSFIVGLKTGDLILRYISNSNNSFIDEDYKKIVNVDFLPESKENVIKAFELLKKYERLQAFT